MVKRYYTPQQHKKHTPNILVEYDVAFRFLSYLFFMVLTQPSVLGKFLAAQWDENYTRAWQVTGVLLWLSLWIFLFLLKKIP